VRTPRPGSRRGQARVAGRDQDAAYLDSPAWPARRNSWYADWLTQHGTTSTFAVCDRTWPLRTRHLHHAAYDGLGGKTDQDLIALCRNHRDQLHPLPDFSATWRALGRSAATAKILGVLRSQLRVQDATRP